jgi:hypothetical protein
MTAKHESAVLTYSSGDAVEARNEIYRLMGDYPATEDEKKRSMGLFIYGALFARLTAISDLYRKIVHLPGTVLDLGTWRGQTAVICENCRAIFEPLHFNRSIICFDTFEGYAGFSEKDKATQLHKDGTYSTGGDYADYLKNLLTLHEKANAMGHYHGKHSVIKGDIRVTMPAHFAEHPGQVIALAFFDLNAYAPTKDAFEIVWKRLVPGGIVAFWQLTRTVTPAEGRVYAENIIEGCKHQIFRSETYPGLCYIVKTA